MRYFSVLFISVLAGCLSDLRPDDATLDQNSEAAARQLIAKMEHAHGGADAWKSIPAASFIMRDVWPASIASLAARPWTESNQAFDLIFQPGRDNGSMTFLNGEDVGVRWGIQNWVTYVDSEYGVEFVDHADAKFWIPTTIYFAELPFRLGEATVARLLPRKTIDGVSYHRVFLTWEGLEPRGDVDQYVVWLFPGSYLLAYVEYTVRDFGPTVVGSMQFSKYKHYSGFKLPTVLQVVDEPGGAATLHRFEIEQVLVPSESRVNLVPDPRRSGTKY